MARAFLPEIIRFYQSEEGKREYEESRERKKQTDTKAVIYARYSCDNQREESIEGQIRENMEFAKNAGIEVIDTYIDRAYPAKTDNRPEFQNMIKDSGKRLFDMVIV